MNISTGKELAYAKEYYRSHKEERLAYYRSHREKILAYQTVYRKRNSGKIREYARARPERSLWHNARARARFYKLPFSLSIHDIVIPIQCPVFGRPFGNGIGGPSIDRVDNSKGYTPDNIRVISRRANILKNNATVEELKKVIAYMT